MTEITGKRVRYMIDPVAFFAALVLAPLTVTALSFWIVFIPVFALVFGGPAYLILGVPALLWWLGRAEPKVGELAVLGFVVNLVATALVWVFMSIEAPYESEWLPRMYLIFGSVFAPVWSGVFARMYLSLRRPFFAQPV